MLDKSLFSMPKGNNIDLSNFLQCDLEALILDPIVDSSYWVERLFSIGIKTIQLRIKNLKGQALEFEVAKAIYIAKKYNSYIFINDYWELAIKYNAYGIHLGQDDLMTADWYAIKKAGIRLGISTHNYYELAIAYAIKPSYIAYGPIFPTLSKKMSHTLQGIVGLKRWRAQLDCTLVAIRGISVENLPSVLSCDVDGVAVISAILNTLDPVQSALEFLNICKKAYLVKKKGEFHE